MNMAFDSNHNAHGGVLPSAERTQQSAACGLRTFITDVLRHEPRRSSMLKMTVQRLGDVSILHCRGRILFGNTNLLNAALSERSCRTLVLDLALVDDIDAGGLGVLMDVRAWTVSHGVELKLLNVMQAVQRVLESTRLNLIFHVCSVREMFHLLGRAEGLERHWGGTRTSQTT